MALAISDDHKALADVVRTFAESNGLRASTRSALEADAGPGSAWKQMAELGWLGLHLPGKYGGSGFGLAELAIVAEGPGAAPAPAFEYLLARCLSIAGGTSEISRNVIAERILGLPSARLRPAPTTSSARALTGPLG